MSYGFLNDLPMALRVQILQIVFQRIIYLTASRLKECPSRLQFRTRHIGLPEWSSRRGFVDAGRPKAPTAVI
ncbi:hypothetical protein PGTUg99_021586 [Puccinia graminis f. sp. tritici]|uniref:Uncharacterized protein n=1 Tax=Puccinia graminis f. sp. tritici TaxID=56615 RepID=A0A5B0RHB5_PUCGR|nr:hypothetical protein PGTUg99_021586 [Puccinia graminis f. sp. tritici]